ncbi:hypothetical protein [Wenxinia marina]|uniref:Cation/multidrug efflux pump n=1 Tax=Wenxinia marina DSM 24838 TaxID=1123501 RepID=A0A0D0PA52_9RHOB|nr:hypothetical protein [Wenxinia marina]KIQ68386.1 hypothetical protein Wenmar_03033 [Wenxinia marina DSM 24838]GGL72621.1 hypothetical protein GCM10011392_29030 [Wenxinia marina]
MFALVRLFALGLVVLSVIYVSVSLWSRARRRETLELLWEERGRIGDRDSFVKAGMVEYDRSLKKRLILGIYVVPAVVVAGIIYLVNYY